MQNTIISALLFSGEKKYWNGNSFGDIENAKENCNHIDLMDAYERAPRGVQEINLVLIDQFDGRAEVLKSEILTA
jgi:hypothetical protein